MKKVIHLVQDLKIGGLERVIAEILYSCDKKLFQMSVWCISSGGDIADELKKKGYEVKILGINSYYNPFNILKLAFLLKKHNPHIIHTHGYFAGTIGRLAGILAGVKNIFHHVHSHYTNFKKRNHLIEKILSYKTKKIICCSNAVSEFIQKKERIKLEKISVIYNGVTVPKILSEQINQINKEFFLIDSQKIIVTVASLTPNKGHSILIEAIPNIISEYNNVKFLFVGDGPCKKNLIEKAVFLKIIDRIVFTGVRRDVYAILSIADIFVLPTIEREGLGISIIEAMSLGKPVVASKVGGILEVVVDGVNGLLVPPQNVKELYKAIITLLKDDKKCIEFGKAGYKEYEKKFKAEKMAEKIKEIYLA